MVVILLLWGVTNVWAQTCLSGDCLNGKGVFRYADGTIYAGEFKNGLADGKGAVYYANGDIYQGEMRDHTFHGMGTLYLEGGTIQRTGQWVEGRYVAPSVVESPNAPVSSNTLKGAQFEPQPHLALQPNPVDIHAVIIGAAVYQNYRSLNFTDDDAHRIYSFFKSPEGGAIPDRRLKLLVDEDATFAKVNVAIDEMIARADDNDMVVIYLSGHGIKGAFLPTDFDEHSVTDRRIYYDSILKRLKDSPAKHKLLVADVCHAGSMEESYLATRGTIEEDILDYYTHLDASAGGTALILSSSAEEVSVEHQKIRQGVFSYYWLQGIKGNADVDGDGFVSISELFGYTRDNVRAYTRHTQNPLMLGDIDPETPLGKVRSPY